MNYFISIFLLVFNLGVHSVTFAQSQDVRDTSELIRQYEKEGQLFTVKIVPKSKNIDVFLVGYKSAGVKFNDIGLEAYANFAGKKYELNVTREKNSFKVEKKVSQPFTLDLKLKDKEKIDSIQFDIR